MRRMGIVEMCYPTQLNKCNHKQTKNNEIIIANNKRVKEQAKSFCHERSRERSSYQLKIRLDHGVPLRDG